MPIRFKCPNPKCQKVLSAKDQQAGKKVTCPACKQVLTIPGASSGPAPAPKAPAGAGTTTDASTATTNGAPADADELAMSLLADEPGAPASVGRAAPVEQPKTLTATCPYCDEQVQFDVALAGKQAPCPNPECRRIFKVPPLTKQEKVDWRKTASGLPSGARRPTEPVPEGAWGSTQKSYVSKEALEEAEALPSQQQDPLTLSQWAVRIMLAGASVGLVVAGVLFVLHRMSSKKKEKLFDKAMAAVSKDGTLKGEETAVVHYAAGIYHLRRNEKDCVKPDKGEAGAWNQFGIARVRLNTSTKDNLECLAMLIELALAQVDLGGNQDQVSEGKRLTWPEVRKEVGVTLGAIPDADARTEGLRRVTRKLIEKGQAGLAEQLAEQLSNGPGAFAVVGLEFLRAGEDERVKKLLKQITDQIVAARPKKNMPLPPPLKVTPDLVTFLEFHDRGKELPKAIKPEEMDIDQVGQAAARAWKKEPAKARAEALKARTAALKLEALIAAADAPGDEGETKATVEQAIALAETGFGGQGAPGWAILRLVPIGLRAGVEENRLLALAGKIGVKDPLKDRLKGWAQLPVVRARLERESGKAEESLADQVAKGTLANRLMRVELARHNARKDSGTDKAIEEWDESLRPFGYIGLALGLQEAD
ncbi:MAG: hypothetical protein HYS12_04115 [Planctomycetes bacterium]|nr:hypothetical protein [Planctomycetota bacterium]